MNSFGYHGRLTRYRVLQAGIAAGLGLMTAGCNRGILDPVGPVASAEKQILIN